LPGAFGHAHAVDRQLPDFLRRDLAALGQLAHFRRDNREALAVLAGTRRFDGRVERQQVGLVGDVVDDADLLGDLLHRRRPFRRPPRRPRRLLAAFGRHAVGDLGVLGVLLDRRGHLLDRGRRFLDRGRLLAGGLRQRLRGGRDLAVAETSESAVLFTSAIVDASLFVVSLIASFSTLNSP
jgi:hypothetical protein